MKSDVIVLNGNGIKSIEEDVGSLDVRRPAATEACWRVDPWPSGQADQSVVRATLDGEELDVAEREFDELTPRTMSSSTGFPGGSSPGGRPAFVSRTCRSRVELMPLYGKLPYTGHGVHDATTDRGCRAGWWDTWPLANVRVGTRESGRP